MTDVDKIREHARAAFDRQLNQQILNQTVEQRLIMYYAEGVWKITPDLIAVADTLSREYTDRERDTGLKSVIFLRDSNNRIVKIEDHRAFLSHIINQYQEALEIGYELQNESDQIRK